MAYWMDVNAGNISHRTGGEVCFHERAPCFSTCHLYGGIRFHKLSSLHIETAPCGSAASVRRLLSFLFPFQKKKTEKWISAKAICGMY